MLVNKPLPYIDEATLYILSALEQNSETIDILNTIILNILDLMEIGLYHSSFNSLLIVILICTTIWKWR